MRKLLLASTAVALLAMTGCSSEEEAVEKKAPAKEPVVEQKAIEPVKPVEADTEAVEEAVEEIKEQAEEVVNEIKQKAEEAVEEVEEIIVEAPIMRRVVGRTAPGAKIEVIELRRRVSYADLDLTKYADVNELKARIETAAQDSCEKLDEMYPLMKPAGRQEIRRCTSEAIERSEEELQAAIEKAQRLAASS